MLHQDDLLRAIDLCYAAVSARQGFQHTVTQIGEIISADAGDLVTEDLLAGRIETIASFGFDPTFRVTYDEAYLGNNPWVDTLASLPEKEFHGNEMDPPEFYRSSYYNEWVRPQGFHATIGCLLETHPCKWTWLGYTREKGRDGFGDKKAFLDQLFPHLQRALGLRRTFGDLAAQPRNLMDRIPRPVFIIGSDRRVVEMNERAECLLRTGRFLRLDRAGRLCAALTGANAPLQRAIHAALNVMSRPEALQEAPAALVLTGQNERAGLAFLTPLRGTADGETRVLMTLNCPEADSGQVHAISEVFGLSPRELALADAILKGTNLTEFALRENISIGTARWHLKNLEQKCGVHRIEELVAFLHMNLPPFL